MKIKVLLAICIVFFLITKTLAGENELRLIKKAIEEKNGKWVAGITSVSELSDEEKKNLCGLIPTHEFQEKEDLDIVATFDTAFDWRDYDGKNWMTTIKNQGACGSCWAFGALGALEPTIKIYYNAPDVEVDLSEQYLVCCCHPEGRGCSGYTLEGTVNFLLNEGAPDEECFRYMAMDASSHIYCEDRCSDWENRLRKIEDWWWVPLESAKYYLFNGPLYVGMAVYYDFMSYRGGVYKHVWGGLAGYHAVALLGWSDSDSCWICKNSWGSNWGENGWFRIKWGECIWDQTIAMIPAEPPYPELVCVSRQIAEDDQYGDGDGILNPGEQALVLLQLQNIGATASEVTGTLQSEDSRITIIDSIETYGDLSPGAICINPHPFKFIAGEEVGRYPLRLLLKANESYEISYSKNLEFEVEVTLNQKGWPVGLSDAVISSPAVCDIDDDGENEIVLGCNDGNLYVRNSDGSTHAEYPFMTGVPIYGSPAIGDVDGDGALEIVIASSNGTVWVLKSDGTILSQISTHETIYATPVLSDFDDDSTLEIIIGSLSGNLHVFRYSGLKYGDFPYSIGSNAEIYAGATIGDLDLDGVKDVVLGTTNDTLYAISALGNLLWKFDTGDLIRSAPSIANIEGIKVVVGSKNGNLYVLDGGGTLVGSVTTGSPIKGSPSFVDLDGDGSPEIVFPSGQSVYICNQYGELFTGWPIQVGSPVNSSVSFADLDNDQVPEIIFGSNNGYLYAYDRNGDLLRYFPIYTGAQILSTSAITHLDDDSDLEIVFGNNVGIQVIDYKSSGGSAVYWNMHRGNLCRTGNYSDVLTGISFTQPNNLNLTDLLIRSYPNPSSMPLIEYYLPTDSDVELCIYNLLGQKVRTLVNHHQTKGHKSVLWDGRDENNVKVPEGIYFLRIESGTQTRYRKLVMLR